MENVFGKNQTYGTTVEPSGEDRDTGSEDVDDGAVVGEGSQAVRAVSGTNGEDSGLRGRRGVGSVYGRVTCGNSHEDTGADSVGSGRVDSSRAAATERHVGNSAVGAAAGPDIVGNKVDTSNDTRVGSRAAGVKDLDSVKGGLLGHTVAL